MYQRKTIDEYEIQGMYCGHWEMVTIEENWKDARLQLKCYRENENGPFRCVKKRVKKEN